jgi:hypothetical protein
MSTAPLQETPQHTAPVIVIEDEDTSDSSVIVIEESNADDEVQIISQTDWEESRARAQYRRSLNAGQKRRHQEIDLAEASGSSSMRETYASPNKKQRVIREPILCPICFDPPKQVTSTECGHLFCRSCLFKALKERRNCPLCRRPQTFSKAITLELKLAKPWRKKKSRRT